MAADVDLDGKVSVEEFDSMIEAAAALPRYIFSSKSRCVLILFFSQFAKYFSTAHEKDPKY